MGCILTNTLYLVIPYPSIRFKPNFPILNEEAGLLLSSGGSTETTDVSAIRWEVVVAFEPDNPNAGTKSDCGHLEEPGLNLAIAGKTKI